ncbi:MAG: SAM-dependent methyltransferase [Alphaproteobacteria bacterium]|nr:SAM-dependent methyltransferase [Alphaproteobacteria bacterium]
MTPLHKKIISNIQESGSITVDEYISIALYTPDLGYYAKDHIIGRSGDFITSPEICQIFGELIGIFMIDQVTSAQPVERLDIIECGPGRGTLMHDILHTLEFYPDIFEKTHIHLVEISPSAKKQQAQTLEQYNHVYWYKTLEDVPFSSGYTFVLANEFFDALPIKQYYEKDGDIRERKVKLDQHNNLCFDVPDDAAHFTEICPLYEKIIHNINERLTRGPGSLLIIDYGDDAANRNKNTLQGVCDHQFADIFESPGLVDISHQVNFQSLRELIAPNIIIYPLITQSEFLNQLGIDLRLQQLLQNATAKQRMELLTACARLTAPQHMGEIFKVLYAQSR